MKPTNHPGRKATIAQGANFARSRGGFTLTEVVVASFLLAILFGAVLRSFTYSRRAVSLIENRLACTQLAREEMEILKSRTFGDNALSIGNNKVLPSYPSDSRRRRGYYNVSYAAGNDNQIKDITVVVLWSEPTGAEHSVSLTSSIGIALHK